MRSPLSSVNANRRARGFSLLELMIVVSIIGILASTALINYSMYLRRSRVSEAILAMSQIRHAQFAYRENPFLGNGEFSGSLAGLNWCLQGGQSCTVGKWPALYAYSTNGVTASGAAGNVQAVTWSPVTMPLSAGEVYLVVTGY